MKDITKEEIAQMKTDYTKYRAKALQIENYMQFIELPFSDCIEELVTNEDLAIMYDKAPPHSKSRRVKLYKAISLLTPRQQEIIIAVLNGDKQRQIAKRLRITQSSISLALHGVNGYGGIYRALKQLVVERKCLTCDKSLDDRGLNAKYCSVKCSLKEKCACGGIKLKKSKRCNRCRMLKK